MKSDRNKEIKANIVSWVNNFLNPAYKKDQSLQSDIIIINKFRRVSTLKADSCY
jgi:hypothetical protein